ncbi:MAG: IS1182 family transposase [Actinomycetia bacterium]|nr:IS1182 family transposase [Actinomycetes bacterium]
MMGKKERGEKLYYDFSLDEKVPQDHILRRIAEAVDFSFVHEIARPYYSHTGKPSVDPVVVLKMALIGYIYGIPSERRLASELPLNIGWLWFLGYDIDEETPDHSILSKARARFGPELYREFFLEVVRLCEEAGLVTGDRVIVDSTAVPANASLESLVSKSIFEQLPPSGEFVERMFAENEDASEEDQDGNRDGDETPPGGPPSGELGKGDRGQESKPVSSLKANERRVSRTDPDCSLVKRGKKKGVMLAYKVHVAIDGGEDRIITAIDATHAETGDAQVFPSLVWKHAGALGRFPEEAVADTAYGSRDVYAFLKQTGVSPFIPRIKTCSKKRLDPSSFNYDAERDVLICPQGNTLKRCGAKSGNKSDVYRSERGSCKECPIKSTCTRGESRAVFFHPDDQVLIWALAHLDTKEAKIALRKRKIWAETVMADLKGQHNLGRAQFRGRWNMEIQAYLSAAAHNLKKLARESRKVMEGAAALSSNCSRKAGNLLSATLLIRRPAPISG